MSIVRTAKGTASDKSTSLTLTLASVQLAKNTTMIVAVGYDAGDGDPIMTWDNRTYDTPRERVQDLGIRIAYFSMFNNGATRTSDVVLTWTGSAPTAKVMFVTQVSETQGRDVFTSGSGTGTAPSSGGIANNFADAYNAGIFVTEGPSTDLAGTPSFSYTAGQRIGTTGDAQASNITIQETYKVTSLIQSSAEAELTGITSRDWQAFMITFKPIYIVSVDARFDISDVSATSQAAAEAFVEGDLESRNSPPYTVTILP